MRRIELAILMALLTGLAGCQSAPRRAAVAPDSAAEIAAEPTEPASATEPSAADAAQARSTSRAVIEPGTGEFIDQEAASRPPRKPAPGDVTFNFEGESVQAVIKAILGDFLQENYEIAPGVQGNVTFATAKPINANQARGVLESILQQNNLAMVFRDGRYLIVPLNQAIPGNLTPRVAPADAARGYEVRVVPLQYISPTEMEKILTPFVRQGSIIRADNARSMLMLAGNASDLQNYLNTIEIFDVNWLKGMSVGVFPLERVEAGTVVPELEKVFGEGGQTPLAGMFRFMPLERLNAVLVITPQKQYLEEAQRWLSRLDRGGSDGGAQLYVYYVKNVKAVDLGDNLSEIFTGSRSSSSSSRSSTPGGSVVPGLQSVEISTAGSANSKRAEERRVREEKERAESNAGVVTPPNYPGAPGTPGAPVGDGIAIVESDDIRITSIEESNALLIRATPGQYDAILQAIKRLDVVPLQVHIEVQILQVDLTNNLNLGVQWFFENALQNRTDPTSGRPLTPPGYRTWLSFAGTASGSSGLGWTFVNQTAASIINTLQSESRVTVISAPSLLVLNNKEASINVGRQIPVNSIIYNPLSTGGVDPSVGNINQSYVQFRDTGTILSVTPRVNPGGLVFLEIKQEQSSPGDSADAIGGNVPVNKRTIETEIAVQSGDTVLLGGLISETVDQGKGGVPGLTKIPLLGRLFGSSKNNVSRAELLVLIKPTVIENATQAKDLTEDYRERFRGLKPLLKKSEDVLH